MAYSDREEMTEAIRIWQRARGGRDMNIENSGALPLARGGPGAKAYPWRALAGLVLCIYVLMGVSIYSFIIFAGALAGELGWSSAQTGGLISAMWLAAPFALFCAPFIKRFGAWQMVGTGVAIEAVALLALAHVDSFWQLYALRLMMGIGKVLTISSAPVIVARHFEQRFGTAMSIVWCAAVGSGLLMAPLTEYLVGAFGWEAATKILGAGILLALPIAFLLQRSSGGGTAPVDVDTLTRKTGSDWQALRSAIGIGRLAAIAIAVVGAGMTSIAIHAHQLPYVASTGLDPADAALTLGFLSGGAILGSATIGWLLDRKPALRSALAVSAAIYAGILLFALLPLAPTLIFACIAALIFGFGLGGGELMWIAIVRNAAPAAIFLTAYGGWYFSLQVGYASGGALGGVGVDHAGGTGLLLVLAAMYLPAAIVSWRLASKPAEATAT